MSEKAPLTEDQQRALDYVADQFLEGKLCRVSDVEAHFGWTKEKAVIVMEELHSLGMLGRRRQPQ